MSTHTYDAVASEDLLAARVVNAPIALLRPCYRETQEPR